MKPIHSAPTFYYFRPFLTCFPILSVSRCMCCIWQAERRPWKGMTVGSCSLASFLGSSSQFWDSLPSPYCGLWTGGPGVFIGNVSIAHIIIVHHHWLDKSIWFNSKFYFSYTFCMVLSSVLELQLLNAINEFPWHWLLYSPNEWLRKYMTIFPEIWTLLSFGMQKQIVRMVWDPELRRC